MLEEIFDNQELESNFIYIIDTCVSMNF